MRNFLRNKWVFILVLLIIGSCGGGGGSSSDSGEEDDTPEEEDLSETVNTEKLVGTPFEGLTLGDDIEEDLFLCGQYRTEAIEEFPIKIFAALFTLGEEEDIQDGIDIANDAAGFTLYELTDTWTDDVRVIYPITEISSSPSAGAQTQSIYWSFNDTSYAEVQATDWYIVIEFNTSLSVSFRTVAHELGHATAIRNHALIDYEEDAFTDFNDENSIMDSPSGEDLPDYIFMMERQGQIMEDHLGESGELMAGEEDC